MRKELTSNLSVLEPKKIKSVRIKRDCPDVFRNMKQRTKIEITDFRSKIGENDLYYKNCIIQYTLNNFLFGKRPSNSQFLKYTANLQRFNISSLLTASFYLLNSKIDSKGDMKTFVYAYFAFNMVSSKYLDDYATWNKSYISCWGISLSQAIRLEIFALEHINYDMTIDKEEIENMLSDVINSSNKSMLADHLDVN